MRTFTRLSVLALALVLGLVAQAPGGGKKGGAPPKNLKLLTPETYREAMQGFTAALGVQCMHCHVQGDFASDDNPKKNVARMMITMAREINAKFPDGQQHVRCYTCHRGEVTPKTEP